MDTHFLTIEITQLKEKLSSLEDGYYFNKELVPFFNNLQDLASQLAAGIKALPETTTNKAKIDGYRNHLRFIKESCIFLEDSTLNIIPYETVYCLNKALGEWVSNPPIIVTSLKATGYFFNGYFSLYENIFTSIKSEFNIDFNSRLILLGIPQIEVYNYLYNIVLYHELGHYVDQYYKISHRLTLAQNPTHSNMDKSVLNMHLNYNMEYFADIFAAQYVGPLITEYLNYLAPDARDSHSHPATAARGTIVSEFISGTPNVIVDHIKTATKAITTIDLKPRHSVITKDDFENFIPRVVTDEQELHGLYSYGWQMWTERTIRFSGYSDDRIFTILNNLIEKSISNYMIREKWTDGSTA